MNHPLARAFCPALFVFALGLALLAGGAVRCDARDLYVALADDTIERFDSATGADLGTFVSAGLNGVYGLAFDKSGNLYAANDPDGLVGSGSISKISPAGVVTTFVTGLTTPRGLAVDLNGNIYVSSSMLNTIRKISSTGFMSPFVTAGLDSPRGLAFDTNGFHYVANSGSGISGNSISKVSTTGVVTLFKSGVTNPYGLAFDGIGNLYAANLSLGTITKITNTGTVSTFASGFTDPYGLAFDGTSTIFAANSSDNSIDQVTLGGVVSPFTLTVNSPTFIAFSPVPEPTAGTLAALGFVGWIARRRQPRCRR